MFESYSMLVRYALMMSAGYWGFSGEMQDAFIGLGLTAFGLIWKYAEEKGWIKGF